MNESGSLFEDGPIEAYEIPAPYRGSLLVLYAFTIVIGVGGNVIVCFIVLNRRGLRTVTNFFIASLSCSDIIMAALCIPFTVLSNLIFYYWPFGPIMCPLVQYLQLTSVLQRALTMVAITFDQHHAIWRPLKRKLKKRDARITIAIIWVVTAAVSLPTAVFSKVVYLPYEPGSRGLCIEEWAIHRARYWYSFSIMLLQYFIPLTVMTFTYIHIGIIIWIKRTPGEADSGRDMRLAAAKRKTIRMLIAVVITYAVSWLPIHTINLIGDHDPTIYNDKYVHIMWMFCHWLALSNSGANPIIYYWMNLKFRAGFIHVFHSITCSQFRQSSHKKFSKISVRSLSTARTGSLSRDYEFTDHSQNKAGGIVSTSTASEV